MHTPVSNIGGTIAIEVGTPATEDQAGYEAVGMVYDEISGITSIPETGNSSESFNVTHLKDGITRYGNGAKSVSPFRISYSYKSDDTGQGSVRANENGNTTCTLLVTHANGDKYYIQGVIGPVLVTEATSNSEKGESFEFRPQSLWTKVAAA